MSREPSWSYQQTQKVSAIMNPYPEFQHDLAQQQQTHQLLYTQSAIANPEHSASTTEAVTIPSIGQLDTVALVQYGGIAVAIILALAVFMLALAEYNGSSVLSMQNQQKSLTGQGS